MPSHYVRGIPTDERLMQVALVRFNGNQELARERLRRIHMLEREYARNIEGYEEVQRSFYGKVSNAKRHARKEQTDEQH